MRVEPLRRRRGWVILGLPWVDCRWCGVYRTKAEAVDDLRGLIRTFRLMRGYSPLWDVPTEKVEVGIVE
jgi:hypothetical protein